MIGHRRKQSVKQISFAQECLHVRREGPSPPRAGAWDRIAEEIDRLRSLADDWDGQGAAAPDPANVDAAMAWVRRVRDLDGSVTPSWIAPGVTGEIVLEWRRDRFHLALAA